MAYHPSGSLQGLLRGRQPRPEAQALRLVTQIATGLRLFHRSGLVHYDLKPSNVLLKAEDEVCLADFGLSRAGDASFSAAGTLGFCAPELQGGAPIDPAHRSAIDVYSLGATLHALLTGHPPRPSRPDLFALERAGVSRSVQALLRAALAEEPAQRPADADRFLDALRSAAQGQERASEAWTSRRWRWAALLVAASLVAAAGYGLGPWATRAPPETPRAAPAVPSVGSGSLAFPGMAPRGRLLAADARLLAGWYAFANGDLAEAARTLDRLLSESPDHVEARGYRAALGLRQGEEVDGKDPRLALGDAAATSPEARASLQLARWALRARDPAGVRALLAEAGVETPLTHALLGATAWIQGHRKGARDHLVRAARDASLAPDARCLLAATRLYDAPSTGPAARFDILGDALNRAWVVRVIHAQHRGKGGWKDGLRAARGLRQLYPTDANAQALEAIALLGLGRFDEADRAAAATTQLPGGRGVGTELQRLAREHQREVPGPGLWSR